MRQNKRKKSKGKKEDVFSWWILMRQKSDLKSALDLLKTNNEIVKFQYDCFTT